MQTFLLRLPLLVTLGAAIAMLLHGPIAQLPHYHDFADQHAWLGVPNAADVLSNLGFFVVGVWGLARLRSAAPTLPGLSGYRLFLIALVLTAAGSGFYHLAPDNDRLLWDRLPIALACAGLLAGVRTQTHGGAKYDVQLFASAAVVSVFWWYITERNGAGDLRPYLLLQALPLVLIPLWLWIYRSPRIDWIYFGGAIVLYIAAKAAELHDHGILQTTGIISGHTLKHLLATGAAATLTARITFTTNRLSFQRDRKVCHV
ncbi:MAG: alkaline phytoceramidase [Burkholderiales bacterium]|nr:alkaline phytoceramidase [Burkholderiales bacterium]